LWGERTHAPEKSFMGGDKRKKVLAKIRAREWRREKWEGSALGLGKTKEKKRKGGGGEREGKKGQRVICSYAKGGEANYCAEKQAGTTHKGGKSETKEGGDFERKIRFGNKEQKGSERRGAAMELAKRKKKFQKYRKETWSLGVPQC